MENIRGIWGENKAIKSKSYKFTHYRVFKWPQESGISQSAKILCFMFMKVDQNPIR
jgi:hypothetical protein